MKKRAMIAYLFVIFLAIQIPCYAQRISKERVKTRPNVDFPEVPRVLAYEAYVKYKAGKAIIIQAGGESFERRHIIGALNIPGEAVERGEVRLPKLPRRGIEIFSYCY